MAKLNTPTARPATRGPIRSETIPTGRTHEGGHGYARDARSELFLLAVTNMVSETSFYETAGTRDQRYTELVHQAALEHPDWTANMLGWLRGEANMRTAAIVGAAEYVHARLKAGENAEHATVTNRGVIASVLQRPDEPGELLGYWTTRYGRALPKPVKRGVADAVQRLYNERAYLKWDSETRGFRMADVIELTHPDHSAPWQADLYRHILDQRHGNGNSEPPASLRTLAARRALMATPAEHRRTLVAGLDAVGTLSAAGMTWEALAGWLQGPMDAQAWQAVIPSMGYMALLRNLRNFDRAGISDELAATIAAKLADPEQVARSRQFPLRFLSAFNAVPSLRWAWPLEQALGHSVRNIPRLGGRTLVLVDTSASMRDAFSRDGSLARWDAATLFGLALAANCEQSDVVSYSGGLGGLRGYGGRNTLVFPQRQAESVLTGLHRWRDEGFFIGAGTDTAAAVHAHYKLHDRVVILTDEQTAQGRIGELLPNRVPLYTWNLAGYRHGHAADGPNRYTFGGLTDTGFRMIPLLEAGRDAAWPWE